METITPKCDALNEAVASQHRTFIPTAITCPPDPRDSLLLRSHNPVSPKRPNTTFITYKRAEKTQLVGMLLRSGVPLGSPARRRRESTLLIRLDKANTIRSANVWHFTHEQLTKEHWWKENTEDLRETFGIRFKPINKNKLCTRDKFNIIGSGANVLNPLQ